MINELKITIRLPINKCISLRSKDSRQIPEDTSLSLSLPPSIVFPTDSISNGDEARGHWCHFKEGKSGLLAALLWRM